jgi:Transcriptional regulatory protein, C terminal/FHA domain
MESESAGTLSARSAEVVVSDPAGKPRAPVPLAGERVSVGRLPEANDIVLEPDPQRLVTRVAHCTFEREGARWFVVDGGSVNGTFLARGGGLERIAGRSSLQDGDVVCVLASVAHDGTRTFFELAFHASGDSQATRAVAFAAPPASAAHCLRYDASEARLVLVRGSESHELDVRAQAHRLVRYMAERNAAIGGAPALCTHDELMHAVWGDEPMHTHAELAKLVWELRKTLASFEAEHLIENERRRGYRLHTCPPDA